MIIEGQLDQVYKENQMKKLLLFISSILGITAFVMMFIAPLELVTEVFGKTDISAIEWQNVMFGYAGENVFGATIGSYNGTILPFIGYILAILGGVATLSTLIFVNAKKTQKLVYLAAGLLLVVAGIFVLLTQTTFVSANEGFEDLTLRMTFAPIFAGIISIVAGLTNWVSVVLLKK